MTVAKLPRVNEYQGVAGAMVFPVKFQFLTPADLSILLRDPTGYEIPAPAGTFSIMGGEGAKGQVAFSTTTAGYVVVIRGRTEISQKTEYPYGNNFPSATHERAVDRSAMIDQEQQDQIDETRARAIMVPAGSAVGEIVPAPNTVLSFDHGGNPIAKPIGSFPPGPPGRADNTYSSYTEMQASDPRRASARLVGDTDVPPHPDGPYNNPTQTIGGWVPQTAEGVSYQAPYANSVAQSARDAVNRERLNLYDMIPRALWSGIEAGTNTQDLTPYVMDAMATGRGLSARAGRYRVALNITGGSGLTLRGEGRELTYFENVDNRPVIKLDSSTADIVGFELENAWIENRHPGQFPTCDLLVITGAGDGEAYQNDQHHFRNLWLFRGRDNIACYNRCIWPTWDSINSTGAIRDCIHIEAAANINQWMFPGRTILKGAGRHGLFFKHDYSSLATGWKMSNFSTEDSGYEGWRFTGDYGIQGFELSTSTFENNCAKVPSGTAPIIEGLRHRKANIFMDQKYIAGFKIETTTFYNGNGVAERNPDWHIYVEAGGAIVQSGSVESCRFTGTQAGGGDISWQRGLTYHANSLAAGAVSLDRTNGSVDMRDQTDMQPFTPEFTFGGGAVGMAPAGLRLCRYQYVGRNVSVQMRITMGSSKGTSTGVAEFSLPVPSVPVTNLPAILNVLADGMNSTAITQLVAEVQPGTSTAKLYRYQDGARVALTDSDFGNFSNLSITGIYGF